MLHDHRGPIHDDEEDEDEEEEEEEEDDDDEDEEEDEDDDEEANYDDYIEDSEFIKHITKQHTDESLDQFNPIEYYRNNSYYNYNIHGINTNVNMNPVTKIAGVVPLPSMGSGGSEQGMPPPATDNKFMFAEQDWSYSQNSNAHNLSVNDQKLVAEIIRQLKPYIYKSIRKEVKVYFERNLPQMNQY
jgi:hypothetical protein